LQLAANDSMQVCNLTTPANLFHVLRRQIKRDFRKPLIIMTPKSLLRHPKVTSTLSELAEGPFTEVITDPNEQSPESIEKLILCSGKVYYDLDKAREDDEKLGKKTAIVRIEQLAPFPKVQLTPIINGYPKLKKVIWAQEEPENMGAYDYVRPRIRKLLSDLGIKLEPEYIGRVERSSPAVGAPAVHKKEQDEIVEKCFR